MSNVARLIKAGTWLTVANVVSKLATSMTLPVLARLLGPTALGIYSLVFTMAQTGQSISSLGAEVVMHRNGAQYKSIGSDAVGRLFGVGMTLVCLTSLICGAMVWLFRSTLSEHWLGRPELAGWLGAAALLIALQPLGNVPLLFLVSLQEFRSYALRSSLGLVFTSAITALMAWKFGLKGAVIGLIVGALGQTLWSFIIVRPALKERAIRLRLDHFWQEARALLRLGLPYYYGNTLLGALVVLPVMGLVGKYAGLSELGYLRVAQSMATIIGFIPTAIAPAALSYLSASLADDLKSFQRLRIIHLRSVWTLLLISTCPVCLMLPSIIRFLFGTSYNETYRLAWISLWLSLLVGIIQILVQYLLVSGKTIKIAWICTIGVACFVLASVFLVPRYHAIGFLLAQVIAQGVSLPFVFYPVVKELSREERGLIRNLILATAVSLLWTFWLPSLGLSFVMMLTLTILTFLFLVAFLFLTVLSGPERIRLRSLVAIRAKYA
jgi:O-antigen/teichoic acid export membrane protein